MSRTFSIACMECKKALWIGQAPHGTDSPYIHDDEKTQRKLRDFLVLHIGHGLKFDSDFAFDFNDGFTDAER